MVPGWQLGVTAAVVALVSLEWMLQGCCSIQLKLPGTVVLLTPCLKTLALHQTRGANGSPRP